MRLRRLLALAVAAACSLVAARAEVRLVRSGGDGLEVECTFGAPTNEMIAAGGAAYHRYLIPGCATDAVPGAPALPHRGILFALPPNRTPRLVRVDCAVGGTLSGLPVPAVPLAGDGSAAADPRYYSGTAAYPGDRVELAQPVQAGRWKVASLILHPMRFDPVARNCQWAERIRIAIEFAPSSGDIPLGTTDARGAAGQPGERRSALINAREAAGWRCAPAATTPKSRCSSDTMPAKILVDRDGWCTVGYADLAAGGIDPAQLDPRTIKVFHGGDEIPVHFPGQEDGVFDPGDRFSFYGERARGDRSYYHPFTDNNVYWLTWGGVPGGRLIDEDGAPEAPGATPAVRYPFTLHREADSLFVRLKGRESDQSDRWFWRRIDEGQSSTVLLPLPDIDLAAGTPATLRVKLHGFTYLDGAGDHRAVVSLNGLALADTVWDGQTPCVISVPVPLSAFRAGDNQLVLAHGTTPYAIDSYFLDWVELEYPRRYSASSGSIEFVRPDTTSDALYRFTIEDMPGQNIAVFKPGVSRLTGVAITAMPAGTGYRATFTDRTSGPVRYCAVIDDSLHCGRPLAVRRNRTSDLAATGHRAEYLIIAPDTLEPQALQLAALRAASFDGAMVALTSDIYDEFGQGVASDAAVREFIRYAYATYDVPPAFVVLMGGGSYDPKNHFGTSRPDYVPVHLSRTDNFGPVPDDDYFVRIVGDDFVADLAVGRLPLSSIADHQAWEAKRSGYEQTPITDRWHRDFLMIAGPPNDPLDDFYAPTDRLCATIDPRFEVSKVYSRNPQSALDLIGQFNEGAVLAAFYGHGGGQVWGHSSFFTNAEAAGLNNAGRWPLVGGFTCYSGAIDIPDTLSLSQQLFRVPGGAVGVFASSGPSWDNWMEQTFLGAVNERGRRLFGEITADAELSLFAMSGGDSFGYSAQMMRSYNLLGDPGMRLAVPDSGLAVAVSPPAARPGDSVDLAVAGPFGSGATALSSFIDGSGRYLVHQAFSPGAGAGGIRWRLPDSAAVGPGWVKLYVKDGTRDWAAAARLAVGQPAFTAYRTTPARPSDRDSIGICAVVYDAAGVDPDSVRCQWKFGAAGDTVADLQETAMAPVAGDTFGLVQTIPPDAWYHQYLNYRIRLADSGVVSLGAFQRCRIWTRPDLVPSADPRDTRLGGRRRLALFTAVRNAGETDAVNVPVCAYTADGDSLFATAVVDTLPAGASRTVELPYPLAARQRVVYLIADPAHAIMPPEQDTTNNRSPDLTVPANGFEYRQLNATGGSGGAVTSFSGGFRWELPDSSLADSAVAVIERIEVGPGAALRPVRQPGLRMLGDSVQPAYAISFTDSALALSGGRQLWAAVRNTALDTSAARDRSALYRHDGGFWGRLPGRIDSAWAGGWSPVIGTFLPLAATDSTGPVINARVNQGATGWGQRIRVARPECSVLIEDPDGVNLDSVTVTLDGQAVPRNQFSLPASLADTRAVPLAFAPTLSDGEHLLGFSAADNLGNRSSTLLAASVSVSFDLLEHANYPNPVDGEFTTFYFFVGDHADRYQLRVYTVAGRLVRTIDGGYAAGIKTFPWDLRDHDGRTVANGVYFYTLAVWQGDRTVTRTGKLAVLR